MPQDKNIPTNPIELSDDATTFLNAITGDPEVYGLTSTDVQSLSFLLLGNAIEVPLMTLVATRNQKRIDLDNSQSNLDGRVEGLIGLYRILRNRAAASPATVQQKEAAGIQARKKPTKSSPNTPTDCFAHPHANGTVVLTWKRGNNKPNTLFDVYHSTNGTDWHLVTSITATKIILDAVPGVHALYKVKARNRQGSSAFSNATSIY